MSHEINQRYEDVQQALDVTLLRCDALELWGLSASGQLAKARKSLDALREELRAAKQESTIHREARDRWITRHEKAAEELTSLASAVRRYFQAEARTYHASEAGTPGPADAFKDKHEAKQEIAKILGLEEMT